MMRDIVDGGERRGLWWGGIGRSDGRVWGRNGGVGIPMMMDTFMGRRGGDYGGEG